MFNLVYRIPTVTQIVATYYIKYFWKQVCANEIIVIYSSEAIIRDVM